MKIVSKKMINKYAILLLVLGLTLSSCSKDDFSNSDYELPIIQDNPAEGGYPLVKKQVPYRKMTMPKDPQKLLFDEKGNDIAISSVQDTVVVYLEGGPSHKASLDELSGVQQMATQYGFANYSVIGMRQAHNINPTVFGSGTYFTDSNAKEVNEQTNTIAENVVSWLKSNKKVVYLFGHSNGSFVTQNYFLSGKTAPNGYIAAGTRIKRVSAFVENYPKNIDIKFENGTNVVTNHVPKDEIPYFNVLSKLQLDNLKNYDELFVGNEKLNKIFYSVSGKDEAVGRIEKEEINFLENNHVKNYYFPDGDHGDCLAGAIAGFYYFRTLQ